MARREPRSFDAKPPLASHVYFIEGAGLVKIGHSNAWRGRTRDLKNMSPVDVELRLVISGGQPVEHELHLIFAEHRHHGEWFALPEGWRELVDTLIAERHLRVKFDWEEVTYG